jgi:hypothetical protein
MHYEQLRMTVRALAAGALVFATVAAGASEKKAEPEPPAVSKVEPQLKADPAILAIIKGLGENSSALLPAVKTAGNMKNADVKKFGMQKTGPRPRDYCLKWVWAADRKRALFCGGNAGVPHRMNDVWEYDLASNTWVLLWEPDPDMNKCRHMKPEQKKKLIDSVAMVKDGVLMTRRGAPFDPVHTWWALTYDPEMKAMLWVMGHQNKVGYKYKKGLPWGSLRLWAYYPRDNRWEFIRTKPYPPGANASILEYIPELKGAIWYTRNRKTMQVFDYKTKTWKVLMQKKDFAKAGSLPGSEAIGAYDSDKKIMVVHHGGGTHRGKPVSKRTYHYDVKTNKWTKVIDSSEGPYGYDMKAPMVYDSVARRCLIVEPKALWSYRVGDKKWTRLAPKGPGLKSRRVFMACYNPKYNVLMADNGSGRIWVYRGKRK